MLLKIPRRNGRRDTAGLVKTEQNDSNESYFAASTVPIIDYIKLRYDLRVISGHKLNLKSACFNAYDA